MSMHKLVPWNELSRESTELRDGGAKLILCHGVFDLLHIGHIKHFRAAKALGDILVVTLTADAYVRKGPGRPAFSEALRAEAISALEVVGRVSIVPSEGAAEAINAIRPYRYVKGSDYKGRIATTGSKLQHEVELVRSFGGDIAFTEEEQFSSSNLINRHFSPYSAATQEVLATIKANVSSDDVTTLFSHLSTFCGTFSVAPKYEGNFKRLFPKATLVTTRDKNQATATTIERAHFNVTSSVGVMKVVVRQRGSAREATCTALGEVPIDWRILEGFAGILDQISPCSPDLLALVLIVFGQECNRVSSLAALRKVVESVLK